MDVIWTVVVIGSRSIPTGEHTSVTYTQVKSHASDPLPNARPLQNPRDGQLSDPLPFRAGVWQSANTAFHSLLLLPPHNPHVALETGPILKSFFF